MPLILLYVALLLLFAAFLCLRRWYTEVEQVLHVITVEIAIGTWFSEKKLRTYDCSWPFTVLALAILWKQNVLNIRDRNTRNKIGSDSVNSLKIWFDATFLEQHEFQYLPSWRRRKKRTTPKPIPTEKIDRPMPVDA